MPAHRSASLVVALVMGALACTPPPSESNVPPETNDLDGREITVPTPNAPGSPDQPSSPMPPDDGALHVPPPRDDDAEAPISLTASDGSGLELKALKARAVLEGPLAFTELHLTFKNPEARVREGRFHITLPDGASIGRFAMKIDSRWQEGEILEKQRARQVYEDFLHRRQDPALLEQSAGNSFTARVFPIPPNAEKELIISFSHELPDRGAPYVLPLRGLSEVSSLDVEVSGAEGGTATLKKTAFVPPEDFMVRAHEKSADAIQHEGLVALRVTPMDATSPAPLDSLTLLVDTSASRALGYEKQVRFVKDLVGALASARDFPLVVLAFDQGTSEVYRGNARGFESKVRDLSRRRPLGASDLERAIVAAQRSTEKGARVVLVTDGVATAGERDLGPLTEAVKGLREKGVRRLDAIAMGGLRDEERLRGLTRGNLAEDGAVLDADRGAAEVARRLRLATASGLKVKVDEAKWVWPEVLDGVQPGDSRLVFAELNKGATLKVRAGDKDVTPKRVGGTHGPLLSRAVAKALIARLESSYEKLPAAEIDAKKKLKDRIVDESVKHRVLSRFTSLLVLETAADYERYGIDRNALTDILTIESGEVVLQKRIADSVPPVPKPIARDDDDRRTRRRLAKAKKGMAAPSERARPETASASDEAASSAGGAPADGLAMEQGEAAADAPEEEAREAASEDIEADDIAPASDFANAESAPRGGAEPPPPPSPRPAAAPARREAPPERMSSSSGRPQPSPARPRPPGDRRPPPIPEPTPTGEATDPWDGDYKVVMVAIERGDKKAALEKARTWHEEAPGDVLGLVALGHALAANGNAGEAARAYGSIIDLFPTRADLLRFAGSLLESLKGDVGLELAADAYERAVEERPDHPQSHRALAWAKWKLKDPEGAFAAMEAGLKQSYPGGRFRGVEEILPEDLGLIAAGWIRISPQDRGAIEKRLAAAGGKIEDGPSLRFVMSWETDANDVDFHIYDQKGGHAYFSDRELASGGRLYADVTTGYGPECFTVRKGPKERAGPYKMQAHYYSRGPMGYGMGRLEVIEHDGKGGITWETRPYVVMKDRAFLELGTAK